MARSAVRRPSIKPAARPKAAPLPKASGKSAVRHLLQQYCAETSAHQDAFRESDGVEPSEFVFVDGSVALMHAAASMGGMGFAPVSLRTLFRKTFRDVQAYARDPCTRAIVVAMDKPSMVPPRKAQEQGLRDAVFTKCYAKSILAATDMKRDAFNDALLQCADIEEVFERCFCYLDDEGQLRSSLRDDASTHGALDLDEARVSAFMWKHFIQNRRCRALIIHFLMSADSLWEDLRATGAAEQRAVAIFRDWETPEGSVPERVSAEGTANLYGEADASWVYWHEALRTRFPARADESGGTRAWGRLSVLTVDTDVMMLGLMWDKFNAKSGDVSLQICLQRAGAPVSEAASRRCNLWIDVRALAGCVGATYLRGGVEWFVRSSVLAGASDFTESSTYPGISISHMADVARQIAVEDDDEESRSEPSSFVAACYRRRYAKTWSRYFAAVDSEKHRTNSAATDWVWRYWRTSVDGSMAPHIE